MTRRNDRLRGLCRDQRGATALEFAFVTPVMLLMLLGFFDVGHSLYMNAVLEGEVQRAARNSGLETGGAAATQLAVDQNVRNQVRALNKHAQVTISRRFYRTFSDAAAAQPETWTDSDNNRACNGEAYVDENNNGVHDMDGADAGQGGARDSVLYTVQVSYPRLLPVSGLVRTLSMNQLQIPRTETFTAQTVMANQPFGDQAAAPPPVARTCPA